MRASTSQPTWFAFLLITLAVGCYGIAFATTWGAAAILVALPCLILLANRPTARQAFYFGLLAGVCIYAPHLWFFHGIFGKAAIAVWLIAGFPIALFVLILHQVHKYLGSCSTIEAGPEKAHGAAVGLHQQGDIPRILNSIGFIVLPPILWTGIEYFRSECYYLKFAWILPGQAIAFLPGIWLERIGVYGLGFLIATIAALITSHRKSLKLFGLVTGIALTILIHLPQQRTVAPTSSLHVAGVQFEHAGDGQIAAALDQLALAHPEAQILVVSEYSFGGPVPESIRAILRKHHRYLIAGGIQPLSNGNYYDIAYVINPDGNDVFSQIKSVPVQLMQDGLPAPDRRVWQSPWGKIGIAICYDISYSRVMDDFVAQGAQGLILPTMDLESWGAYERKMLHGRLGPIRSAEYGIPTFSLWSSGESQLIDRHGHLIATAGYPGQGETIAGPFDLANAGTIPPDRWLAFGCMIATGAICVMLLLLQFIRKSSPQSLAPKDLHMTSQ
jgi:apolipoprotein N-acyltransferase